jgi:hypothetical protein
MTINYLLVILALLSACAGVGNVTFPRFTPNWVALALAFWFASMVVR